MYKGSANWNYIASKEQSKDINSYFGNGDIDSPEIQRKIWC